MQVTARRPHSHLCPDCNQLHRCLCDYGWRVAFVSCGCLKTYDPGEYYDKPGRVEFGD